MISVCVPTYKGLSLLKKAIDSVRNQTYGNYEIVICNDSQNDAKQLKAFVESYKDPRIILYQNKTNLGYSRNVKQTYDKSKGEYVFLLAQDDVVLYKELFSEMIAVFKEHPEVGAITRPYYWFVDDINVPIRMIPKIRKRILDVRKNPEDINYIIETVGQLSGLFFKRSCVEMDFTPLVFTAHIRPFLSILRNSKCYYMPKFTTAIGTESSQTRFLSSIYSPSPTKTWVEMLSEVFSGDEFKKVRGTSIDHMCQNYVGFLQIKNYGFYKDLLVDIYYLLKFRPQNVFAPKFWVFTLASLLVPRLVLRWVVDNYKKEINRKKLSGILK
ncbi:MAG: glycosyltransferase family 2 protein [Patescibacteria group bacterium]|jgi:glycosyltransferase involved in cell wall biosynthesis